MVWVLKVRCVGGEREDVEGSGVLGSGREELNFSWRYSGSNLQI